MKDRKSTFGLVLALAALLVTAGRVQAFQPIPKVSARTLGVTRGKSFTSGLVFVNGKYLEPPYVVERWGTGIRINGTPVTGQVVDWNEFLRTQSGVKTVKTQEEPSGSASSAAAEPIIEAAPASDASDASSLDDLFDDDPKPAKAKPAARSVVRRAPPRPRTTVTYSIDGEFEPNEASNALLARINAARTEIDRFLRAGGFICFGDSYSRVNGDKRILTHVLDVLPELQQNSSDVDAFRSGIRAANLVYFNELLCKELFRNRTDYRKLKERRARLKSSQRWDSVLDEVSEPLF